MTLRDEFRALADDLGPKTSTFDWDGYRRLWFEYEGSDADRAAIEELGWEEFSRRLPPVEEFSARFATLALPITDEYWQRFFEAYYERDEDLQDRKFEELDEYRRSRWKQNDG